MAKRWKFINTIFVNVGYDDESLKYVTLLYIQNENGLDYLYWDDYGIIYKASKDDTTPIEVVVPDPVPPPPPFPRPWRRRRPILIEL